jgi:Ca-activated chloride channel homolog
MRTPPALTFLAAATAAMTAVLGCGGAGPLVNKDNDVVVAQVGKATSLIKMTAEPSAGLVLADAPAQLAVRIRIEAPPLADADRPPLHLALVLDTSGSMEGEAIDHLKGAAGEIVRNMTDRDSLSLVAFHSRAEVLMPSTALRGPGRADALAAIDKIRATGTTDLASGLSLGIQQLVQHRTAGTLDRMVLVADGFPNDPTPIPAAVQSAAANGIAITTLGVGSEPSEQMLATIAKDTGGVYRYAPDGTEIATVFKKELLRIQTLVARNMTLRIGPGPGIEPDPAPWLQVSGRDRWVSLGDLAAGEVRDVIVPLSVPAHHTGLTIELLDADLSFTDALAGAAETRSKFVGIKASSDAAEVTASIKTDLVKSQARLEAAGSILQAINLARSGAIDQAKAILADAEAAARRAADKLGDPELAEMADRMIELGRNLAQLVVQVQIVPPNSITDTSSTEPSPYTHVPAQAPPSVEPAIRKAYESAKTTIDGR